METNHINILLIDSHISDASKIRVLLEHTSKKIFRVWHCNSRSEALLFLKEKSIPIDAVILDLFLIDPTNPKETYKIVSAAAGDIPVVVIAGQAARSLALEVTGGGAADVVVRERFETYPQRLLDAIEFSIIRGKLLREMKEKSANEVRHHKQILHWMSGGYSIEADVEAAQKTPKERKPVSAL